MADVLDQTEVDALLAAVESGGTEHAASATFARREAERPRDVQSYDFKRPERVSKDQMRVLESIHEGFARNFGAALSGFLRTIIEVRVATAEQLTYSEFIHSLPNPTNFNLLTAEPLEGQMCLEISPLIIYPIIDRLLGGPNTETFIPQRPLTMIELRLVKRITDRALSCLTEVWSNLIDIDFSLAEVENNPHLVQIVAPNEVVVVIGFEIKIGQRSGTMSFCIPFTVIEPVMSKLATQGWLAYKRRTTVESRKDHIAHQLQGTKVDVVAILAETDINVQELVTLSPGDIIQTDKPIDGNLLLKVAGRPKFACTVGRYKEKRAVKILHEASPDERF
ncbi:MAG: flagellar motor switch protein FliM [Phycisphaerales bacterium]|nr:flagellar motor switch protein FliM [Phycisphaerales bacterium]